MNSKGLRFAFYVAACAVIWKLRGQALQGERFLWGWILGDRPCAIASMMPAYAKASAFAVRSFPHLYKSGNGLMSPRPSAYAKS